MSGRRSLFAALALAFCAPLGASEPAGMASESAEMTMSRQMLTTHHGDQRNLLILGERFEQHLDGRDSAAVWEAQAWYGGDVQKLWIKTEGEYATRENRFEEAELQALYSRAVHPFWDVQFGVRHDVTPNPSRTYAVVGVQGLAPYWFELDGAAFLSDRGDLSLRLEAEYELRLTQRLLLQPRLELNAALSDDRAIGVGAGLSEVQAGLRLRYEIVREFAPYIGLSWSRAYGKTRTLRQRAGEDSRQLSVVAGLRFWF